MLAPVNDLTPAYCRAGRKSYDCQWSDSYLAASRRNDPKADIQPISFAPRSGRSYSCERLWSSAPTHMNTSIGRHLKLTACALCDALDLTARITHDADRRQGCLSMGEQDEVCTTRRVAA